MLDGPGLLIGCHVADLDVRPDANLAVIAAIRDDWRLRSQVRRRYLPRRYRPSIGIATSCDPEDDTKRSHECGGREQTETPCGSRVTTR